MAFTYTNSPTTSTYSSPTYPSGSTSVYSPTTSPSSPTQTTSWSPTAPSEPAPAPAQNTQLSGNIYQRPDGSCFSALTGATVPCPAVEQPAPPPPPPDPWASQFGAAGVQEVQKLLDSLIIDPMQTQQTYEIGTAGRLTVPTTAFMGDVNRITDPVQLAVLASSLSAAGWGPNAEAALQNWLAYNEERNPTAGQYQYGRRLR